MRGLNTKKIKYICKAFYYITDEPDTQKESIIAYDLKEDRVRIVVPEHEHLYEYLSLESISLKDMIIKVPEIKKFIDK